MRANTARRIYTAERAPAHPASLDPVNQLRRSVMSCLLWEDGFYCDGEAIAARIVRAANAIDPVVLAATAREARGPFGLRHAPLLLLAVLADTGKGTSLVADAIADVIRRADELGELLAIREKLTGKRITDCLTHGMRRGLARALLRFDQYQLAKYANRPAKFSLRDALFLSHAKPRTPEQELLFRMVTERKLASPDTWEVALSAGGDKRETFTRLLQENRLGYLALLRNLRNMEQAGVDVTLVEDAILERRGARGVLPFQYVAAARAAPQWAGALDRALLLAVDELPPLGGKTTLLVDVSGSMTGSPLSAKSSLTRSDAAGVLAGMVKGERVRVLVFGDTYKEVPHRVGTAMCDVLAKANPWPGGLFIRGGGRAADVGVGHGTNMGLAYKAALAHKPDRIIGISDEQSHDPLPQPPAGVRSYVINVAAEKHGVGYGAHVHCDGFSEQTLRFIAEYERG